MLKGYTANYNDVDVDFTLELDPDYYPEAQAYIAEFESKFKLTSSFKTTNMVAFNSERKITRYDSPGEILEEFYSVRLAGYAKRKAHELARMAAAAELPEASVDEGGGAGAPKRPGGA